MIKKLIASLSIFITLAAPVAIAGQSSAATVDLFDDVCKRANSVSTTGTPSACQDKNVNGNPIYGPSGVLINIANILTVVIGIAAVIAIIAAGLRLVTSGSNPDEVSKAREYVQYAVIGLAVAATAQLLVRVVLTKVSL